MVESARQHVIAPHRIVDEELERVVYGPGDRVPYADAVKYGLVEPEATEEPQDAERSEKPSADRAKRPSRNTAKKPAQDR